MPKINQEEYEVLKNLDDKRKWIARNYNGALITFTSKPTKNSNLYWDSFGERMDDRLFQFIQWEDQEPYNISELIEEYEIKELRLAPSRTVIVDSFNESEETEVKKQELIKIIKSLARETSQNYPHEEMVELPDVLNAIAQLDEPEVLSQKFIDKYSVTRFHGFNPEPSKYVPVEKLQNLLVPKQGKKQKYNVKFKVKSLFGAVGIFLYKKGNEVLAGDNFGAYYPEEDECRLTEQEIRDFQNGDILFDHFATPVEELEE